jgi:hypothetical protein
VFSVHILPFIVFHPTEFYLHLNIKSKFQVNLRVLFLLLPGTKALTIFCIIVFTVITSSVILLIFHVDTIKPILVTTCFKHYLAYVILIFSSY